MRGLFAGIRIIALFAIATAMTGGFEARSQCPGGVCRPQFSGFYAPVAAMTAVAATTGERSATIRICGCDKCTIEIANDDPLVTAKPGAACRTFSTPPFTGPGRYTVTAYGDDPTAGVATEVTVFPGCVTEVTVDWDQRSITFKDPVIQPAAPMFSPAGGGCPGGNCSGGGCAGGRCGR